ncbi:MAG TPA: hypothetical protein DCS75_05715 [Gemmatimonadetes bacterium]|nr:hypothetical protein [Gemmatimonadota bacterium]HBV06856.1 hypothetical protein [Gemmatimonadota bacterium]
MRRGRRHAAAVITGLLGMSLSSCHLPRWPVEAPLTSGFGLRFLGRELDVHRGIDFAVNEGTPIHAMSNGRIQFAGTMAGFGKVIWINHSKGLKSIYAHLSTINVRVGQRVGAGEIIGESGATGDVTAAHLHFEVWRWGKPVDPISILGGSPDILAKRP